MELNLLEVNFMKKLFVTLASLFLLLGATVSFAFVPYCGNDAKSIGPSTDIEGIVNQFVETHPGFSGGCIGLANQYPNGSTQFVLRWSNPANPSINTYFDCGPGGRCSQQ